MTTTLPSEFRLIPARAGLNAVAVPQGRNIQAGTAILNLKRFYFDVEGFDYFSFISVSFDIRLRIVDRI